MTTPPIHALILAGGSGTRFWPASRRDRPKQLLPFADGKSLLAETVTRLAPLVPPEQIWVCTTERLAAAVDDELESVPSEQILAEPMGRNTAPAIGWAVRTMMQAGVDGVVAVLPSDHWVGNPAAFRRALEVAARDALDRDRILTLGVRPRWAESGFGYLELEAPAPEEPVATAVRRFVEKPSAEAAARFVEGGRHLWNGGIFVCPAKVLWRELVRHQPEIAAGIDSVIAAEPEQRSALYENLAAISIDHGVMEHVEDIATVPLDCEWSDLGSWEAMSELIHADEAGNRCRGETILVDARDNLVISDEGLTAVIGVEGLAVIRTGDATLVMPRERAQDVRHVVAELKRRGIDRLL